MFHIDKCFVQGIRPKLDAKGCKVVKCISSSLTNRRKIVCFFLRLLISHRFGAYRKSCERAFGSSRARATHAARSDQLQAHFCGAQRILWRIAVVTVHGPNQSFGRDHAQAPCVCPWPWRFNPRACRL